MASDDPLHGGQAESPAVVLGGEEGLKDACASLGAHSPARITHFQQDLLFAGLTHQGGPDLDASAPLKFEAVKGWNPGYDYRIGGKYLFGMEQKTGFAAGGDLRHSTESRVASSFL